MMVTYAGDKEGAGKKIVRKLKEVGLKNVLIGGIKKVRYMQMINKYHFDTWHLSPYEWKEYAQVCVLFGELSAPRFFTLNAPVFRMVWINIQNS